MIGHLFLHDSPGPTPIYWYKTWKNFSENFGASFHLQDGEYWEWKNWENSEHRLLIGSTCLVQW